MFTLKYTDMMTCAATRQINQKLTKKKEEETKMVMSFASVFVCNAMSVGVVH